MRLIWIVIGLAVTGPAVFGQPPESEDEVTLEETWVQRMVANPSHTALEFAEFFVRLPQPDWLQDFAVELRLLELLAVTDQLKRDPKLVLTPAVRDGMEAAGLNRHGKLTHIMNDFARTFLLAIGAEPAPARDELLEWLLKTDGEFWTRRVIEGLIARPAPVSAELERILPFVPGWAFAEAARALATHAFDSRRSQRLMNMLVLHQAFRGEPLHVPETNDHRADRCCANLLAQSRQMFEPVSFEQGGLRAQGLE